MKRLVIIVLALTLAVVIGLGLHQNGGMMAVTFAGWRVDMPLWIGILSVFILYVAIHYVLLILKAILHAPRWIKNSVKSYQIRRAKRSTERGFVAFTMGDFKKAHKALAKGAAHGAFPWLNYVFAAQAAGAIGNTKSRDVCLYKANMLMPEAQMAVQLTKAKMQCEEGEYTQCIAALNALSKKAPHHPAILKLLQVCYLATEDWIALSALLPKLKRSQVLSTEKYNALEHKVWCARLHLLEDETVTTAQWQALWKSMPKHCHDDPEIALIYNKALQHLP